MVKKGKELKEAANEDDIFDFKAQLVTLGRNEQLYISIMRI